MRIVAVTTRSPFPLVEGRALRTFNLLREAARHHEIELYTYVMSDAEADGLGELRKFCAEVHGIPLYMNATRHWEFARDLATDLFSSAPLLAIKYKDRRMMRMVTEAMRKPNVDVLHIDMLHLGELVPAACGKPVVLVEHNFESALLERRVYNEVNPLLRAYLRRQLGKVRRYECETCKAVDHVVAVSDVDAQDLRGLVGSERVTVVPNGVDTDYFRPSAFAPDKNRLVFVGGMTWYPNLDAVQFMASEILPLVASHLPGVKLTVVGAVPKERAIERLRANGHIEFVGLVDDIRPLVQSATAFVVPLRVGGGTRLKILDALAMGKAVVSTSVGCEGLAVTAGRDVLIADSAADLAACIVSLLQDAELAARLGGAGRKLVEGHYRWGAAATKMEAAYERAIGRHNSRRAGGR